MVITFFGTGIIGVCVFVDSTRRLRVDEGELLVYPKRDNFPSGVFYATNLSSIDLKSHVLVILFENLVGSLVHYLLSSNEGVINSNFLWLLRHFCHTFLLLRTSFCAVFLLISIVINAVKFFCLMWKVLYR